MKNPLPLALLSACLAAPFLTANVLSWRNGGNGTYPDAQPPLDWTDSGALLWKVGTPARANACPILVGGKLIYTAEPAELICADAETGKTLWSASNDYEDVIKLSDEERAQLAKAKEVLASLDDELAPLKREEYQLSRRMRRDRNSPELRQQIEEVREKIVKTEAKAGPLARKFEKPSTHDTNGYASYTPFSDGKHIYYCNGLGVVAKYDLDGERLWAKTMEKPDHSWGGSVSPVLVGGKLVVRFSDYTALDPETGEELWRVENPITFNAPASFELDGQWFLYTCRGELIRVADGKKLPSQDWTVREKGWCFFNTHSVVGSRVYCSHGTEGAQGDAYCMEIPKTVEELERSGLKQIWHTEIDRNRYYSSPIVHEGLVYLLSREQQLEVLDAETGKRLYTERIEGMRGTTYPSLTLAGDLLFAASDDGTVVFLKPGPKHEEVSRFRMDEFRSTPIFAGGRAYLRTHEHLYAFQAKP